jgi:hypothetical protein
MVTPPPFSQGDHGRLLRVLGDARRELTSALIGMPRRSLLKAGAETVVENIDELAFLLTGHRKFFHLKLHSTSWTSPSSPPPNDTE